MSIFQSIAGVGVGMLRVIGVGVKGSAKAGAATVSHGRALLREHRIKVIYISESGVVFPEVAGRLYNGDTLLSVPAFRRCFRLDNDAGTSFSRILRTIEGDEVIVVYGGRLETEFSFEALKTNEDDDDALFAKITAHELKPSKASRSDIIASHMISEALDANILGFMRKPGDREIMAAALVAFFAGGCFFTLILAAIFAFAVIM